MLIVIKRMWAQFFKVSNLEIARRELEEARCRLIAAEADKCYAGLMVTYHQATIERHSALLRVGNKEVFEPQGE